MLLVSLSLSLSLKISRVLNQVGTLYLEIGCVSHFHVNPLTPGGPKFGDLLKLRLMYDEVMMLLAKLRKGGLSRRMFRVYCVKEA